MQDSGINCTLTLSHNYHIFGLASKSEQQKKCRFVTSKVQICSKIAKSIPARIKLSIADSSSVDGPKVAIIFVRLSIVVTSVMV